MSPGEKYKQPNRYTPVIAAINWRLRKHAEEQQRVTYVDCNDLLLQSSTLVRTQVHDPCRRSCELAPVLQAQQHMQWSPALTMPLQA